MPRVRECTARSGRAGSLETGMILDGSYGSWNMFQTQSMTWEPLTVSVTDFDIETSDLGIAMVPVRSSRV